MLNALEQAGYDRSFERLGESAGEAGPGPMPDAGAFERVAFDPVRRTVKLPPGVRLDLGGTGKGWAAHQAMKRLSAFGPALVDAGGDLAASGPPMRGSAWPVGLADPFDPDEDLAMLALGKGGAATSGRDHRRWRKNGTWMHHIINPITGRPAETNVISATVLAPDALQAESAAKVALILGSREGLRWLEGQQGLDGLLVLEGGETVETPGFDRCRWREQQWI